MKVLSKNSVMEFVKKTAILWVMIILILILSVISPSFFRGQNLLNIIKQASITGVIGVGMTFVLITGGIDLSVGSVMALSGTMAASVAVAEKNMPIALVILVGVGLGALCGLINGIGVSYIGFPPFIMTLGMMTIARGIPLVFTNGTPIFGLSEEFNMIANYSMPYLLTHSKTYFYHFIFTGQHIEDGQAVHHRMSFFIHTLKLFLCFNFICFGKTEFFH